MSSSRLAILFRVVSVVVACAHCPREQRRQRQLRSGQHRLHDRLRLRSGHEYDRRAVRRPRGSAELERLVLRDVGPHARRTGSERQDDGRQRRDERRAEGVGAARPRHDEHDLRLLRVGLDRGRRRSGSPRARDQRGDAGCRILGTDSDRILDPDVARLEFGGEHHGGPRPVRHERELVPERLLHRRRLSRRSDHDHLQSRVGRSDRLSVLESPERSGARTATTSARTRRAGPGARCSKRRACPRSGRTRCSSR
jgi:hypothetical protein